jgi:hypothetical protein
LYFDCGGDIFEPISLTRRHPIATCPQAQADSPARELSKQISPFSPSAGFSSTRKVALTDSYLGFRLPARIEIRPHVRAALAAGLADEVVFEIGQPNIVGVIDRR